MGGEIISFPHDVAAKNRSKSIRQRSPAGTRNGEDFHIQRHGEKSRQLTDRQKKDVNDFFCINLSNSSKKFTAPLDCLLGFEPCFLPLNVGEPRLAPYLQGFARPPCTIHSQTPWSDSIHSQEHSLNPSSVQEGARCWNAKWKYAEHSFYQDASLYYKTNPFLIRHSLLSGYLALWYPASSLQGSRTFLRIAYDFMASASHK